MFGRKSHNPVTVSDHFIFQTTN